ncbi:MAG: phosphoenolpyruvate carboxylase [Candidatus Peribacteraceae bacterium]|nr:phosphoenolpyruvate carboxylase [Candidatus Peribacteraceae bacterium]
MATQHPDNASAPWWRQDAFVPTADEIDELLLLFKDLPIDEYMWDWEGKYVDESVGEKLFSRAQEFFTAHPLGESFHLTYRIPAWAGGKLHRMARAFMNILSLADLAKDIGLPRPPVTEMFLPLTTSAEQPIQARKAFADVAEYHRSIFHQSTASEHSILDLISMTPLVEDIDSLFSIERILEPYWSSLPPPEHGRGRRIFLARSDPAMNSGLVPAVLAVKAALSTVSQLAEKFSVDVCPILGTGSLPFRGSVNPSYTETFLAQYAGTRTYSIQSAFRYDYPLDEVKEALAVIHRETPKRKTVEMSGGDRRKLRELADAFEGFWKPTIESLAEVINAVAAHVPARRERLLHIGLFGYSRGVGKVRLPRAIGFTAALYSLGIPPELIATGRGLKVARERGMLDLIEKYYPALREDLKHAGKYLNRENVDLLARRYPAFEEVKDGIGAIEEIFNIELGPEKPRHIIHRNITSTIFHRLHGEGGKEELTDDIVQAGVLRCSLG